MLVVMLELMPEVEGREVLVEAASTEGGVGETDLGGQKDKVMCVRERRGGRDEGERE